MKIDHVEKFLYDRKHLIRKYTGWQKVKKISNNGLPIIHLPSPQLLAGFAGYLKYQFKEKVYFRGEGSLYDKTIPSLFRVAPEKIDQGQIDNRKAAFDKLIEEVPKLYKSSRFKKEELRPLLQHYRIRTDWIDLVDNIFVALWFSNYSSSGKYTYIKFFHDGDLLVVDLREKNSSLSLRPHCQHGVSASKKNNWKIGNLDFKENLIAIAQLPNDSNMHLSGHVFSETFMFPDEKLDNTYKLLRMQKFQDKLSEIESKYRLANNALGQIK